ncbi:TPA: hypothetical protein ACIBVD_001784 [Salmonella enterica subsp. enterica serovar Javiana]
MFEVKLLVSAPGLETAINNLASAIAGNGVSEHFIEDIAPLPAASAVPVNIAPTVENDDNDGDTSTDEFDGWGLRHDSRIHTDNKSINKGDKLWRLKKKLDEAFVDGVKRELIAEAVNAGRYTGPAELAPGYVAPVDSAPAVPVAPAAPVVPTSPVTPAAPVTTDPAKVYNSQVLQSALMQMFGQITGDRAAPISQRILALYNTQNIMALSDPTQLKSAIDLIEKINAAPAEAENVVAQAESMKAVGGAF